MKPFDRNKSLEELEGKDLGEPTYDSYLVTECHRLMQVPLREFSTEGLRLMIGQSIGLAHLVPLALERLHQQPLAEGDYYRGDLLVSVLRADAGFWVHRPDLCAEVHNIAQGALERLRASGHKRLERLRTTLDCLNEAYEDFSKARTVA